jgi:glyoxylase-like metal-dependent hydrolase (beta-lactamase superfamily II)
LEVTPDLACLQQPLVNVYLFGEPRAGDRGWALIDAGLYFSASQIVRAAEQRFGAGARPAAIILTHGHFDHVGALPDLADHWNAPVYAHERELPYLTGRSSYPPPDPAVGGGAMSFLSRFYPRGPIDLGSCVESLPDDGSVPGMPGFRWIHTPGHTHGHVALFRDADRTLIAGDAFVTTQQESALAVMTGWQQVSSPPAYYTTDWQAARRSIVSLAALVPNIAATGHGLPMYGEQMRQQLDELLADWDVAAVPSYGRYIQSPAIADEQGVVSVPPPVFDRQLAVVAGIGAAAVVAGLLLRSRR